MRISGGTALVSKRPTSTKYEVFKILTLSSWINTLYLDIRGVSGCYGITIAFGEDSTLAIPREYFWLILASTHHCAMRTVVRSYRLHGVEFKNLSQIFSTATSTSQRAKSASILERKRLRGFSNTWTGTAVRVRNQATNARFMPRDVTSRPWFLIRWRRQ